MLRFVLGDLRYGWRQLRRKPAFAVVAVLVLAIGIGANTSVFSVVNALLLHSLPFREPQQLDVLWNFLPPHDSARQFEYLTATAPDAGTLTVGLGAVLGVVMAQLSGQILASLVDGAKAVDVVSSTGLVAWFVLVGMATAWMATWRIARLDVLAGPAGGMTAWRS